MLKLERYEIMFAERTPAYADPLSKKCLQLGECLHIEERVSLGVAGAVLFVLARALGIL